MRPYMPVVAHTWSAGVGAESKGMDLLMLQGGRMPSHTEKDEDF